MSTDILLLAFLREEKENDTSKILKYLITHMYQEFFLTFLKSWMLTSQLERKGSKKDKMASANK